METYLQFNPASTIRVEEQVSVRDNRAFLRHIPKKGSVVIDGFTEVDGAPQANQFYCDYATDSLYRDANRVLHFGQVDDFTFLTVNYIAVGTVVTADDMNEIKAHLENDSIHGGAGDKAYFVNNSTKMIATGGLDYRNIDDEYWAIDSRIGRGLDESFQSEVGRAPQVGDIVQYYAPGNDVGYTIRITDKWVNLGYYGENDTSWDFINPLLTIKDRQKLDSLTEPYQIGDEFYLQNNKLHLQTANENTLGGVKVGDGLQLNSSAALCLKAATASQLGGIKIGDGFYLQNNKLYLQTANENTLGGVKVGDGLQLNNSAALCLKAATASQLGGIKIGDGLVKDLHEVLSVELPLSNADRKLLDYLHDQLDDQLD